MKKLSIAMFGQKRLSREGGVEIVAIIPLTFQQIIIMH